MTKRDDKKDDKKGQQKGRQKGTTKGTTQKRFLLNDKKRQKRQKISIFFYLFHIIYAANEV